MITAPTTADNIDTMASVSTQPSSPEVSEIKYHTEVIIRPNALYSWNGTLQCDNNMTVMHTLPACVMWPSKMMQ
jgi:hypothetical protein